MVEAPEKIWVIGQPKHGTAVWMDTPHPQPEMSRDVEYTRSDIAERQIAELRADKARLSEALMEYENPSNWGVNARFDANSGRFDGTSYAHGVLAALSDSGAAHPVQPEWRDSLLDTLAEHKNFELSWGAHPDDDTEACWQVYRVNGGRNDREWTLIGVGNTPHEALYAALPAAPQPKGE